MSIVARVWKDPVGSKVIATAICWGAGLFADRYFVQLPRWSIPAGIAVTVALALYEVVMFVFRKRSTASSDAPATNHSNESYHIEIHTEEDRPYHKLASESGHRLSTVSVGIKNFGDKTLSNCRVYVEKITPRTNFPIAQPALALTHPAFNLWPDDPEQIVEVATHWDHFNEFRFSAPFGGGFGEAMLLMDGKIKRTFVLRVAARECSRSALFEISADDDRRLHLKFLDYLD